MLQLHIECLNCCRSNKIAASARADQRVTTPAIPVSHRTMSVTIAARRHGPISYTCGVPPCSLMRTIIDTCSQQDLMGNAGSAKTCMLTGTCAGRSDGGPLGESGALQSCANGLIATPPLTAPHSIP
eukprot:scaffold320936_cov41-Tisochrysis_lutea.AAC.2